MTKPSELTQAQYEIVRLIHESDKPMTVSDVWPQIEKTVARTTVLTWIQRLEKRGWLKRVETEEGIAYTATRSPEDGATNAAERVLDTLFQGSPTGLVLALAGRGRIDAAEAARLRDLLDELEKANEQ